jgi:hypothetical protein
MDLKDAIRIKSIISSQKTKSRQASPRLMPVEATPALIINFVVVILLRSEGHFVRDNTLLCFKLYIVSVLP